MPMDWEDAKKFCADLGKKKHHGQHYELPTIQQLASVLDYTQIQPALTLGVFSNVLPPPFYWSATPPVGGEGEFAFVVDISLGFVTGSKTDLEHGVWCVRRDKNAHADW
jgi:hypothetical protein